MDFWLPHFYETLLVRLSEAVDTQGQTLIQHADLFYGQYDIEASGNEEDIDPYNKPAVFFDAQPYEYQNLGNKVKAIREFEFFIHCQTEVVTEVAKREVKSIRERQHEHFQLHKEVERLLQGFNGSQVTEGFNGFNSIMCLGSSPYEYRGMSIIHIARFKTRITIDANALQFLKLEPPTVPAYPTDEITTQILP